ncbi:MAG: glycosyl hydrolase [Bacteroides sp.]|nr:glycosyl hydrolase [Bacteroides sp.]
MKYLYRCVAGILFFLISLSLLAQQSSHNGAPKYAPADGEKLLIMGQDLGAVGGLDDYSDGYVDHLNHVPAGITTYTGFPSLTGLTDLANWGSGDVNAQAYVEDETFDHSLIVFGLHLVDQLGSIISGGSDSQLDILGGWIKSQERPVFLRIGYEFDGSWNHYDPGQFKEAWIYIVHHFDDLEIRNVSYVWQAYGGNTPNIGRWYPGDRYVNWMGYSHFNEPNPGANILAFAELHDKPVMIAEATPKVDLKVGDGAAHWTSWYAPLYEKIYSQNRIKALAYINVNWDSQSMWQGQGWGDSRVQVNEVVMENWQMEIQKAPWVLASDSLFELLDYQKWQDMDVTEISDIQSLDDKVQILSTPDGLLIRSVENSRIDEIRIWDMNGRLRYVSETASPIFEIPAHLFSGVAAVVLQVRMGETTVRKKAMITKMN